MTKPSEATPHPDHIVPEHPDNVRQKPGAQNASKK